VFADDAPGTLLVEDVCPEGVTVAEVGKTVLLDRSGLSAKVLGSILPAAFEASSEQLIKARTEPRTRTDFRNWCFIVILK